MSFERVRRLLVPVAALLLGFAAGHWWGRPTALAAADKPRQYKVLDVDAGSPFEKILNEQARDGWTYRSDISDRGTTEMLIFER